MTRKTFFTGKRRPGRPKIPWMSGERGSPPPRRPGGGIPLHERIRERRRAKGMQAQELAERVGISPSYISLIESGVKIPSESVAEAIARALDDDVEMYVAWVHTGRSSDPWRAMRGASRLSQLTVRPASSNGAPVESRRPALVREDPGPGESRTRRPELERQITWREAARTARGENDTLLSSGPRAGNIWSYQRDASTDSSGGGAHPPGSVLDQADDQVARVFSRELLRVPVLAEGTDPGIDPAHAPEPLEVFPLHPRVFPGRPPRAPFAYRLSRDGAARVDGYGEGDLVVLSREPRPASPQHVFAVRCKRIVLSRVLVKGNALLLLPSERMPDFELVEPRTGQSVLDLLAGSVVLRISIE